MVRDLSTMLFVSKHTCTRYVTYVGHEDKNDGPNFFSQPFKGENLGPSSEWVMMAGDLTSPKIDRLIYRQLPREGENVSRKCERIGQPTEQWSAGKLVG